MLLDTIAPKKFLCHYDLCVGARIVGILMSLLMLCCIVATLVQTLNMQKCESCTQYSWKNAYSFSVTAVLYCCIMFAVNVWFLWGIKKEKASVILSWVVITATWMAQTLCLLIVLLCMYSAGTFLVWILCLIFAFIGYFILIYCLLVGYGYWLELRNIPISNVEVNTDK